ISMDYSSEGQVIRDGSPVRPEAPEIALPCLSFIWEIVTPPEWRPVDCGPGLSANDPKDPADWLSGPLGLWRPSLSFFRRRFAADVADRIRLLDERLDDVTADELSLAECFARWDSGPWPILIDRLALVSAGLGPRSTCAPRRVKSDRRSVSLATLQQ